MSRIVRGQVPTPTHGPLVVATDGSVARDQSRRDRDRLEWQTGWGYMSTHGHYGAGWCPQPHQLAGRDLSTVAELRALWHAVGVVIPHRQVTVLCDSQNAIGYINRWRTGDTRMPSGYLGSQKSTPRLVILARAVRAHGHNLTVRWVPGHAGHVLNEAADSLARIGCRWRIDRVHPDDMDRLARDLAGGFVADPRLRDVS